MQKQIKDERATRLLRRPIHRSRVVTFFVGNSRSTGSNQPEYFMYCIPVGVSVDVILFIYRTRSADLQYTYLNWAS